MTTWQGKKLKATVLYTAAGVGQHILVESGNDAVLVDCGDGCLRDMLDNEFSPSRLKGIIITHGHYDHMGGLHSLLGFLRMIGRSEPLIIGTPPGCTEVLAAVATFQHCYPDSISYRIEIKEFDDRQAVTIGGLSITPYAVVHCGSIAGGNILDPIPAMGYRITFDDETVAVSGDTGDCPALRELVEGVDLAFIEATYSPEFEVSKEALAKVHLSTELAEEIGGTAKKFIPVHPAKKK